MDTTVTSVEYFHTNCLRSWDTYTCPVCYYMKNPYLLDNYVCMKCGTKDTLWFCITCGHVGCGHLVQRHALEHYAETQHIYVMGLQEFKVWDYRAKQFLHHFDEKDHRLDSNQMYNQVNTGNNCSCAVCQHNYNPKLVKKATCMECKESQAANLWICLDCYHIGCSKDKYKHALQHFTKTQHTLAMQMFNFSIWDYKAGKYQHRRPPFEAMTFKTETNQFESEYNQEDVVKRFDHLEQQLKEFSKLTEINKNITTIQDCLLNLIDEKNIFEKKLEEHDQKLKAIQGNFAGNYGNSSTTRFLDPDVVETVANVDINSNRDCVITDYYTSSFVTRKKIYLCSPFKLN